LIYQAPRSWAERTYRNLTYFKEVGQGGHFGVVTAGTVWQAISIEPNARKRKEIHYDRN